MTDRILKFDTLGFLEFNDTINVSEIRVNNENIKQSSLRAIVDPSLSVGPLNGLLIPSQPDFYMKIPLRTNTAIPALGLCNGYNINYNNEFTLFPDFIRINTGGSYHVSFGCIILSTNQNERKSIHLLQTTQTMFIDPPIVFEAVRQGNNLILGPYTYSYNLSSSGEIYIPVPTDLSLFLYLNNNISNNEILRNSYLTISRIS